MPYRQKGGRKGKKEKNSFPDRKNEERVKI